MIRGQTSLAEIDGAETRKMVSANPAPLKVWTIFNSLAPHPVASIPIPESCAALLPPAVEAYLAGRRHALGARAPQRSY